MGNRFNKKSIRKESSLEVNKVFISQENIENEYEFIETIFSSPFG